MFHQYFQDPLDCSFVLLFYFRKDQNIIQVHHYDPLGYESFEDVVHHSLEGGRTISYSEEHHEGFKEAMIGMEGRLLFISRLDAYVIETPVDV